MMVGRDIGSCAKRGYYADPASPIASTPYKRRRRETQTEDAKPSPPSFASPLKDGYRKDADELSVSITSRGKNASTSELGELDVCIKPTKLSVDLVKRESGGNSVSHVEYDENEGDTNNWPGKVVQNLFSPMLKMFGGNDDEVDSAEKENVAQGAIQTDTEEGKREGDTTLTIYAEEEEEEEEEELDEDSDAGEFNPYLFIKYLPPYAEAAPNGVKVWLPRKTRRCHPITLALDLDETLVHCSVEEINGADLAFPIEFDGMKYEVHVKKRPYLQTFLETVSKHFEVVLFTASQQVYAEKLLNYIDPGRKLVRHRLFRDACLPVDGNFLKDLNVLGRDLSRVILVDNSPHAFGYQVENGVPIESWFDDEDDKELLYLLEFLKGLIGLDDVRPAIEKKFQLRKLIESA